MRLGEGACSRLQQRPFSRRAGGAPTKGASLPRRACREKDRMRGSAGWRISHALAIVGASTPRGKSCPACGERFQDFPRIRRTSNLLNFSTAYRRQVRLRACGKVSANLPPAVLVVPISTFASVCSTIESKCRNQRDQACHPVRVYERLRLVLFRKRAISNNIYTFCTRTAMSKGVVTYGGHHALKRQIRSTSTPRGKSRLICRKLARDFPRIRRTSNYLILVQLIGGKFA